MTSLAVFIGLFAVLILTDNLGSGLTVFAVLVMYLHGYMDGKKRVRDDLMKQWRESQS